MDKLKILIADDSVLSRRAVADAVEGTGMGRVEHTAPNGSIAIEWLRQSEIDVVLLGSFIMGHNSLQILRQIKEEYPDVEVIMLTNGEATGAEVTIEALASGALDFVVKAMDSDPDRTVERIKNQLGVLFTQLKVKKYALPTRNQSFSLNTRTVETLGNNTPSLSAVRSRAKILTGRPDLVLIASSTGGPPALEVVLKQLPVNFPVPILVVQHMPPEFTHVFAEALDKKCRLRVSEARHGEFARPGEIIIAAGGLHMTVCSHESGYPEIRLENSPYVNGVRPSADVLFDSVARAYEEKNILAIVLTGMGNDGEKGVAELKRSCNCYCITQSEGTCVVYGMPRCVSEAGLSDETLDIENISGRICRMASVEGL